MSYTKVSTIQLPVAYNVDRNDGARYTEGRVSRIMTLTRTRTGDRVPDWREKIEKGQNAGSNLSGRWITAAGTRHEAKQRFYDPWNPTQILEFSYSGDVPLVWDYGGPPAFSSDGWNDDADNRAKTKFWSAMRSEQIMVSGLTFLGELRETLSMIRRPAEGLQSLAKGYLDNVARKKRGFPKNPVNWARDLGNLWLEQAFGWTPLMSDIRNGIDAYNSFVDKDRTVRISKGAKAERLRLDETGGKDVLAGSPFVNPFCRKKVTFRHIVRYRGALRVQAATTARDRFSRFGFTPQDFIPTAWELLPWSFLVDYFTNIGDILEAVHTVSSNLVYVNKSDITESDLFSTWWMPYPHPLKPAGYKYVEPPVTVPGYARIRVRDVQRTANSGLSYPDFRFKLPGLKQAENMTALLGQANKRIHGQTFRFARSG